MWPSFLSVSVLMLILQCVCHPTGKYFNSNNTEKSDKIKFLFHFNVENESTGLVGIVEDEGKPNTMDQELESSHAAIVERPAVTISPAIITATAKNVTVAHGKTALLTCKIGVGLLDNRTVFINYFPAFYLCIYTFDGLCKSNCMATAPPTSFMSI